MTPREFHAAWCEGWEACESFYEQSILNQDPDFQRWLTALQAESARLREQQEVDEAMEEAAHQTAAGRPLT
jgi:hypothetical protein